MSRREFAEFVYGNLIWDGMEAVLYKDGFACTRQLRCWGTDQDEIVMTVPLGSEYWNDSWIFDELYEYDPTTGERQGKEVTDEQLKEIMDGIYDELLAVWGY